MRYTLLELTQRILGSMDSDEVNDINDTAESREVANIIKECYFDIAGTYQLPEKETIFQLTASGDNDLPCLMTLPTNVLKLTRLYYNDDDASNPHFYEVFYKPFSEFIALTNELNTDDADVGSMTVELNGQDFVFKFLNTRLPRVYTSYNDRSLIFDSYDTDTSSTLVSARTLCYGPSVAEFTLANAYVPDLDPGQFQLLLQSAKAQAFLELKQVENPKAEKKERRNHILAQRNKDAIDNRREIEKHQGFGRRRR